MRIPNVKYELMRLDESREVLLDELSSMQKSREVLLKKLESLETKKSSNDEKTSLLLKELTLLKKRKAHGETEQGKMKSIAAYYENTEMDRLVKDLLGFVDSSEYLVNELLTVANEFGYFKEYQHIIPEQTSSKIRLILMYFLYSFKEDFTFYLMERDEEEKNDLRLLEII